MPSSRWFPKNLQDQRQVEITRNESGDLIIHPLPSEQDRGAALLQTLSAFDDDFAALLEEDRREPSSIQDREEL